MDIHTDYAVKLLVFTNTPGIQMTRAFSQVARTLKLVLSIEVYLLLVNWEKLKKTIVSSTSGLYVTEHTARFKVFSQIYS